MRVLHLIDPINCGWPALVAMRSLCAPADASFEHHAVLIGGESAGLRAHECGVRAALRLSPALQRPELAAPALRRWLRDQSRSFDLIHAWSPAGRRLAWAVARSTPVAFTPVTSARPPGLRSASAPVRTPVDLTMLRHDLRPELRARWGISNDTVLLLSTGEPTRWVCARHAAYVAGLLRVAGIRAAAVVPRDAQDAESAARFADRIGMPVPLVFEDRPLWELLPACDLAMWRRPPLGALYQVSDEHPSPDERPEHGRWRGWFDAQSLFWCGAAGVPIVASISAPGEFVPGEPCVVERAGGRGREQARAVIGIIERLGLPDPAGRADRSHLPAELQPVQWRKWFEQSLVRRTDRSVRTSAAVKADFDHSLSGSG